MRLLREIFTRNPSFRVRGFLPMKDPLTRFQIGSPYEPLDAIGDVLPEALEHSEFRRWATHLDIPMYSIPSRFDEEAERELQLYYVRIAFLISAYVHQVGQPKISMIPHNIAKPLAHAAYHLARPPILSYDGYALYNWRRFDPKGPVALGNIDTFQNFVDMYDEHWFILVHIEIEAIGAEIHDALAHYVGGESDIDTMLWRMHTTIEKMTAVLRRIPEHMDPELYFSTFRPYIKEFKDMKYEGVHDKKKSYRGETGAQSSILPILESILKIPHKPSILTEHLSDMRLYMPLEHIVLIAAVDQMPSITDIASKEPWNAVLEAMAEFRHVHLGWAHQYIYRHGGVRGTGGTPYMAWLDQLVKETLAARKL